MGRPRNTTVTVLRSTDVESESTRRLSSDYAGFLHWMKKTHCRDFHSKGNKLKPKRGTVKTVTIVETNC
jgi:hypothetical protein